MSKELITKGKQDIEKLKRKSTQLIASQNYDEALRTLKCISKLMYSLNFTLRDNSIEKMCNDCIEGLSKEKVDVVHPKENVVAFYDGFGTTLRGLASIYIKALCQLGYHIVYITYKNTELSKNFIYHMYDKEIELVVLPWDFKDGKCSLYNVGEEIKDIIHKCNVKHAFLYTLPYDVAGYCAFKMLDKRIKKYLINLTDHAFWIGNECSDFIVEFRKIGAEISQNIRGIDDNKIYMLPFYPQILDSIEFSGLPKGVDQNDIFVFSGGSEYKVRGSNKFFQIISLLLDKNTSLKFVFASNDTNDALENMKVKFPGRFIHISERPDFYHLIGKSVFYLNTYPMFGGLMTQYAIIQNIVPLSLVDDLKSQLLNPDSMLKNPDNAQICFDSVETLVEEANKIINDVTYREQKQLSLDGQISSEKEFVDGLKRLLTASNIPINNWCIEDVKGIEDDLLKCAPVKSLDEYDRVHFSLTKLNRKMLYYFPIYNMRGACQYFSERLKKIVKKIR